MTEPTLESYQGPAVAFLSKKKRALVHSPAGSGKTIIAAAALSRVIQSIKRDRRVSIGWVANTIEQCDQARKAIALYPALQGADIHIACPAGVTDEFQYLDVLVVDEAHHATAATWAAIVETHQGALWMFTATPWGEDEHRNQQLRDMVGDNIHVVPREAVRGRVVHGIVRLLDDTDEGMKEPIDKAISQELDKLVSRVFYMKRQEYLAEVIEDFCRKESIARNGASTIALWNALDKKAHQRWLDLAHEACRDDMWPRVAYRICLDMGVAANGRRNAAIIRLAKKHAADSTLVLVNSVMHGEYLREKIGQGVVCHSKMGAKRRREAMADFSTGVLRLMIATSLADEGLDQPRASTLILAGAGRSSAKIEQRTGRVLRSFQDKTHGVIYDFEDPQHPLLASQARKRQKIYRELGYTIEKYDEKQQTLFA